MTHWLHHRAAAINLRRLGALGLTHTGTSWPWPDPNVRHAIIRTGHLNHDDTRRHHQTQGPTLGPLSALNSQLPNLIVQDSPRPE